MKKYMCPTAKLDSVYNLVQVLQYVLEVTFRKELIRKKLWLSLLVALSKHTMLSNCWQQNRLFH